MIGDKIYLFLVCILLIGFVSAQLKTGYEDTSDIKVSLTKPTPAANVTTGSQVFNKSEILITNLGNIDNVNATWFENVANYLTFKTSQLSSWLVDTGFITSTQIKDNYLSINGSNANQNIDVSPYNLTVSFISGNTSTPTHPSDIVNKDYVDDVASAIAFDFFFTNHTSNLVGHWNMSEIDFGHAQNLTSSVSLSTGVTSIFNWTSEIGQPEFNELRKGVYDVHFHAYKSGTKSVMLIPKLYNISADGTERNLLITFEESAELTDTGAEFDLHGVLSKAVILSPNERLTLEFNAEVGASGSAPKVIIKIEGTTDSHLSIETSSNAFEQIFLRQDGTTPLTNNWNYGGFNLNGSGNFTTSGVVRIGTMNISSGSIVDSDIGGINFGSTALVTTGSLSVNGITTTGDLTMASNDINTLNDITGISGSISSTPGSYGIDFSDVTDLQLVGTQGISFRPVSDCWNNLGTPSERFNSTHSQWIFGENITSSAFFIGDGRRLSMVNYSNITYQNKADYQFTTNNFNGSGDFNTTGNITANYFIGEGVNLIDGAESSSITQTGNWIVVDKGTGFGTNITGHVLAGEDAVYWLPGLNSDKLNLEAHTPTINQKAKRTTGTALAFSMFELYAENDQGVDAAQGKIGFYGNLNQGATPTPNYIFMGATAATAWNNVSFKIDAKNMVGIGLSGSTRPSYPLEVGSNVSDISIYAKTNVSATGYITRSPSFNNYIGNDLDYLVSPMNLLGNNGKLNSTNLYSGEAVTTIKEECSWVGDLEKGVEVCINKTEYGTFVDVIAEKNRLLISELKQKIQSQQEQIVSLENFKQKTEDCIKAPKDFNDFINCMNLGGVGL